MQEHLKSQAIRDHEEMIARQHEAEMWKDAHRVILNDGSWVLQPPKPIISKTLEYATMATEGLKSTMITNLDASPMVQNTAGQQGPFVAKMVDTFITTTSGVTAPSTYKMLRLPTKCYVKSVMVEGEAMTAGAFDIGLYYSDSTTDGTPQALQNTAVDADLFATAVSFAAAVTPIDVVNESGTYTLNKRFQPLWQAAGLSADPGGFFDVVFTSTATITTGARMGVRVTYADGA